MADEHSAAGPALGYQYQADFCLYALLTDAAPGRSISLELHDDVSWEEGGTATEKIQVKHKVNSTGGLGNASDAMWRTLKAWMDSGAQTDQDGPSLFLVTTGSAQAGSAAHALRTDTRDAAKAAAILRKTAGESQTAGTAASRAQFLNLSAPAQNRLISHITVVDSQPSVTEIDQAIRKRMWMHMPKESAQQDDFMASLWGWWRGRVVEMLSRRYFPDRDLRASVSAADLKARMVKLTVDFSEHGLPEYEDLDVDDTHESVQGLDQEIFVKQLGFLKVHPTVIRRAVVDYFRATSSETRWLERDFLRTDDVQRYERKLREAWDVAFGLMLSGLDLTPSEEEQAEAGRLLLADVLSKPPLRIRDQVDQDFYYRGKHHMLAQDVTFGWHPDFAGRVSELLLGESA